MKVIKVRNVCQALSETMEYLLKHGEKSQSRGGAVLVAPNPMITVTECPRERVLFSAIRDANPFFHMAEAIWMLSGANDAKFLDTFIHNFSAQYAEKNGTLHDAYGYRWRKAFGFDQLNQVVHQLVMDPNDRQCVIQMWDALPETPYRTNEGEADCGQNDLLGNWKSKPCNTHIFLRVNNNKLDLTVCCRSNDMLWGCHGANAVHFSILQEYLAARIDTEIGTMYQLSNNAHIYLNKIDNIMEDAYRDDRYNDIAPLAMFEDPEYIDEDIQKFMSDCYNRDFEEYDFSNSWFYNTLYRALEAHRLFKEKQYVAALIMAEEIEARDWRAACYEWIDRRVPPEKIK